MTAQPLGPLQRTMLPAAQVAAIRAARQRPRPTLLDHHHLRLLRDCLAAALAHQPTPVALDLYCGSRPYDWLVPADFIVGVDIDLHFGGASVVATLPLPFADASFGLVVCTQALYLVDDPAAAVAEARRVLAPGGRVVVTVPSVYRREHSAERAWSTADLCRLFEDWVDVEVTPVGGPGYAGVYALGRFAGGAARRLPALRALLPAVALLLTAIGWVVGPTTRPLARRRPHLLVLTARPGGGAPPP